MQRSRRSSKHQSRVHHVEALERRQMLAAISGLLTPDSAAFPGRSPSDTPSDELEKPTLPVDVAGSYLTSPSLGDSEPMFFDDVFQGNLDTCTFASVLSAVARTSFDLESSIRWLSEIGDTRNYDVRMYTKSGTSYVPTWRTVSIGSRLADVDLLSADSQEFWPAVFQKAYLDHAAALSRNYKSAVFAFESLTGRTAQEFEIDGRLVQAEAIKGALDSGRPVTAGTVTGSFVLEDTYGLITSHAYTVVGIHVPASKDLAQTYVTVRNPWGKDTHWSYFDLDNDGQLSVSEYRSKQEGVDGNNDGIIRIPWNAFSTYFERYTISGFIGAEPINDAPRPDLSPVFANPNIGPFTVRQGERLGPITISATHPEGKTVFYSLQDSPGYIQVQSGRFEWEPNSGQSGTFMITVVAEYNEFETASLSFVVNVLSGAPRIDSLSASPGSIQDNGADLLELQANNVRTDIGTIDRVEFFRDADNDGILNDETDVWLGRGTQNGSDWTWSGYVGGLEVGTERFFARALRFSFSDYHYSRPVGVNVNVTQSPYIPPVAIPQEEQKHLGGPNYDQRVLGIEDDGARGFRSLVQWRYHIGSTLVTELWTNHHEPDGNGSTYGTHQIAVDFSEGEGEIAALGNGDYAVAWIKNSQIHVRWSNYDGSVANTFTIAGEAEAGGGLDIATDAQGNLLIAYHKGSYMAEDVWAVTVARDGTVLRAPWRVHSHTEGQQKYPSVSLNDGGWGVIAWSDPHQGKVMGRGVFSAGVSDWSERELVNSASYDMEIETATAPNNMFYVAWGNQMQRFSEIGDGILTPITVPTFGGSTGSLRLEMGRLGIIVAAWYSSGQDPDPNGGGGAYSQILTYELQKMGPEFRVPNITEYSQSIGGIALQNDGTMMYGFTDGGYDSPNVDKPYYRMFDLDADPVFALNNIFGVAENSPAGTRVGRVEVSTGSPPTFEVPAAAPFTIDAQTGEIRVKAGAQLDHETQSNYSLDVLVRAGSRSAIGTVQIYIGNRNDAPTITGTTQTFTYRENAPALLVTDGRTLDDVDSADMSGGNVYAKVIKNASASDRLTISDSLGVTVRSDSKVLFGGKIIGTMVWNGVGTNSLSINLNANATLPAVQRLLQSLAFATIGQNPATDTRSIRFRVADGDGGVSINAATNVRVVRVNDAPVLSGFGGSPVGYPLNRVAPVTLVPTASLVDVDHVNYANGKLRIQVTSGIDAGNRIELGGTLFSINSSNQLVRNGVVIGTVNANAGRGLTKFEVTFVRPAVRDHVWQLMRAIRFRTEGSSLTDDRIVTFTLFDPLGARAIGTKKVDVQ